MQKLGMSLPPLTNLSAGLPTSTDQPLISAEQAQYAAERARVLFGCYRKGDANDPDTYTAAITAVLAEYPPEVMRVVTDPRTGMPRKLSWLPTVKEVSDACDAEVRAQKAVKYLTEKGWRWTDGKWVKPEEAA